MAPKKIGRYEINVEEQGGIVTILVSTGKKTVDVPDVVGKQLTDAVAALTRAGLNAKSVGVASDKPPGTVTAQDPRAGTSLVEGATVRINYSTGPKQVAVPPVVGLDYSTALQQLQAMGCQSRTDNGIHAMKTKLSGVVISDPRLAGGLAMFHAIQVVPGPTTGALLILGASGLCALRRRK